MANDEEVRIELGTSVRTKSPQETLATIAAHLPRMGVVRLADLTGLDRIGVPVAAAVRPNAAGGTLVYGKGVTHEVARVSAAMEAVERFHAERPTTPIILSSLAEIASRRPILNDTTLLRVAGKVFDYNTEIAWVEGTELNSDTRLWLPFELVTVRGLQPMPHWTGFFRSETTGVASGNTLLEATIQALYEIVERDSRTFFVVRPRAEQSAARIDPGTVSDSASVALLEKIERAGLCPAIWDVMGDMGIPCFLVRVLERDDVRLPHLLWCAGGGANVLPAIALRRALTEAIQGRAVLSSGASDDLQAKDYAPANAARRRNWKRWLDERPTRVFTHNSEHHCASYAEELQTILRGLAGVGCHQAVLVDLTRPEFGIPVASVCVPGTEDAEGLTEKGLSNYVPGPRLQRYLESPHA
jgi:ribosomal protein S12 methylthiotransferase accessory factor